MYVSSGFALCNSNAEFELGDAINIRESADKFLEWLEEVILPRERERERVCVCERESVCVCVRERERERDR